MFSQKAAVTLLLCMARQRSGKEARVEKVLTKGGWHISYFPFLDGQEAVSEFLESLFRAEAIGRA